jgi:SAM-dependent methyltransferase
VLISIAAFWRLPNRLEAAERVLPPSATTRLFWLAGSFVPSALMLAVTTHLSVNLASVPFLWTLPLAVYLLTFILAFARHVRVSAELISRVAPALLLVLIPIFAAGPIRPTILYLGILSAHLVLLLVGGLLCHTALADSRPEPAHLTEYYAWIAFGGVLGGAFAAIIAPSLFSTVLEYPLLAATLAFFRKPQSTRRNLWDLSFLVFLAVLLAAGWGLSRQLGYGKAEHAWAVAGYLPIALVAFVFYRRRWLFAGGLAALILVYAVIVGPSLERSERLHVVRNFFGVKKVVFDPSVNERRLLHGDTLHGIEGLDPDRTGVPLSYYFRNGPLGDVMSIMSDRPDQHVGVVGLGSGTIAAYTQPNRKITFFEIDPQVEVIAREYFGYLPRCGMGCDVVLGDGRLSILNAPDAEFDLLVLDAFNSDAIPAHLLSREAVEVYKRKLKPNGAILFHVSNRYLRIRELVVALAFEAKLPAFYRSDDNDGEPGKARSMYVIAAPDPEAVRDLPDKLNWVPVAHFGDVEAWTDDYSNLWAILRWR